MKTSICFSNCPYLDRACGEHAQCNCCDNNYQPVEIQLEDNFSGMVIPPVEYPDIVLDDFVL